MCCRRDALLAVVFLVLAAFSALPSAAAAQPSSSCDLLPWEQAASPVTPTVDDQAPAPFFAAGCTSSSQCQTGYQCHCGQCHPACISPERWNCICQTCYLCGPGMYFDSGSCSCEYI
ncbi:MAG: hypothetical protein ABUT39_04355 [Acidobacteriota bacterium]